VRSEYETQRSYVYCHIDCGKRPQHGLSDRSTYFRALSYDIGLPFSHTVQQFLLLIIAYLVHFVPVIVVILVKVSRHIVDVNHHHEEFQFVVVL
jgi:hypothetical protein